MLVLLPFLFGYAVSAVSERSGMLVFPGVFEVEFHRIKLEQVVV